MKRILVLPVLACVLAPPLGAVEIKQDGWLFPNPAVAEKLKIQTRDYTPRIPGKETEVKIYKRKKDGVVFDTFEIDGEVYACQFHIKGEGDTPPTVYAIVDTDGDGVFESKYAPGEKANPPEWAIKRYYKKHPDQTEPGAPVSDSSPRK
jgi:uncharacterized protein DUF2782